MSSPEELKELLWKRMSDSPIVMVGAADGRTHAEPLRVQLDEEQADTLNFFVGKDNRLAGGGPVMVQFVSKGHDFFACLAGDARIDNDPVLIDKLWSNAAEAWFPGGRSDPNLALLRIDIDSAELWEADVSLSGKLKMLFGGTIKADEAGSHAKVETTVV